jgi:hypothetical protein
MRRTMVAADSKPRWRCRPTLIDAAADSVADRAGSAWSTLGKRNSTKAALGERDYSVEAISGRSGFPRVANS